MASIHSINISKGGVPKLPVNQVKVNSLGLVGDYQNDLKYHGGVERAICIYSLELIEDLKSKGNNIFPGSTGENLTIKGLNWSRLKSGIRFLIGDVMIKLTTEATPCKTISSSFISGDFSRISGKKFPGSSRWYASVIQEGLIQVGDELIFVET